MRLTRAFALVSVALSAVAFACGGSEKNAAPAPAPSTSGRAGEPPGPEGAPTTSTELRTYALTSFTLGDLDRTGNVEPEAWRKLGYDVDGLVTNAETDLARTCQGAQTGREKLLDGDDGIDNSFGRNIVPLLSLAGGSPSKALTAAAVDGRFTLLVQVTGFVDDPAQTNTGLSGGVLFTTPFGGVDSGIRPSFTTGDDFPYLAEPQPKFENAYVVRGELVNGKGTGEFPLLLSLAGSTVRITVHHATISFKHDPASQAITTGTISGVVETKALVDSMDALASRFPTPICPGELLDNIKTAIANASDILRDGAQDPARPCDGISIGLGFEAKRVGNPTTAGPPSPDSQTNPCADAGP
ncbi:MAG: hypothetical protein KIT84_40760 [Labilithrix sp.]|nr:hypothetical protein [Labilithrix sp.]MCW5817401.1 hypothetical protein [Labilithrix sp.]